MQDIEIDGINFHGDGVVESYETIGRAAQLIKGISGLTCEIGVRRGLGSVTIMKACQDNNDKRIHIGIDPWGDIAYTDIGGTRRIDYTNSMKRETLKDLYRWCHQTDQEFFMFTMKDTEFFERFATGIPVHNQHSKLVNEYAYIFIDGPHQLDAVQLTIEFFEPRTPIGGVWQLDNTNHYNHAAAHAWIIAHGFEEISEAVGTDTGNHKKTYQRVNNGKM